jgi:hypothetical protein
MNRLCSLNLNSKFCFTSCTVCVYSLNQYFPRGGQPIKSNSANAYHISLIANMTGRLTTTLRHTEPLLTQTLSTSGITFTQTDTIYTYTYVGNCSIIQRYRAKAYAALLNPFLSNRSMTQSNRYLQREKE